MPPSTISGINRLPDNQKREQYARVIPPEIFPHVGIDPSLKDAEGRSLFSLNAPDGSSSTEIFLYHQVDFPDPVLYGQITDTLNGQFHILFYVLSDPSSPRFDIDQLPDGTPTQFGILHRNLEAEQAAMEYGLAPGQVRRGLRLLGEAIQQFERFVSGLGHTLYFAEPLFYNTAVLFERYGFTYQQGRKLMQRIQTGLQPGGDLIPLLDGSTPFRRPEAANSVRLRSWAIHDGLLGEPFNNVTMYKHIGKQAGVSTCEGCDW